MDAVAREVLEGVAAGSITRNGQFTYGFDVAKLDFIKHSPEVEDLAIALLGPDVKFFFARILMKDAAFNGNIVVHQDWPYFGGDTRKLNLFIPLTRCNEDNGMLAFYERSHRMGPVERGAIDAARFPDLAPVIPDLRLGDILATDMLTWHSSVPAKVDSPRIIAQIVLTPGDDPCAVEIICGGSTRAIFCPDRIYPMEIPQSSITAPLAQIHLDSGDLEGAERGARWRATDATSMPAWCWRISTSPGAVQAPISLASPARLSRPWPPT